MSPPTDILCIKQQKRQQMRARKHSVIFKCPLPVISASNNVRCNDFISDKNDLVIVLLDIFFLINAVNYSSASRCCHFPAI